jgi:hypothetical protein
MKSNDNQRFQVLQMLNQNYLTLKEAAELLRLSYRHLRRLYKRYQEHGLIGLIHGLKGRRSNRRIADATRKKILSVYMENYMGCGPGYYARQLAVLGYVLNRETLRCWMIEEGLWHARKKGSAFFTKTKPTGNFGQAVWLFAYKHAWLGKGNGDYCLFSIIDEATGTALSLMEKEESMETAMRVLWQWVEKYGIPMNICCEERLIFGSCHNKKKREEFTENPPKTAFHTACVSLGVEVIIVTAMQIKEHLEHIYTIYNKSLAGKLKTKQVQDLRQANLLLNNGFIREFNQRFTHPAASLPDFHVKLRPENNLANIFCYSCKRPVSAERTLSYKQRCFQITDENSVLPPPHSEIELKELLDGSIHVFYKGKELKVEEIGGKSFKLKKDKRHT